MSELTITDDAITAEYSNLEDVWSVHIMLDGETYVGVGCATSEEIPAAKAEVRARCAEIWNARAKEPK